LKPTCRWDTFIEKIFDNAYELATLIASMNPFRFSLSTLLVTLLAAPAVLAQEPATATTDPVGFVTVGVAAGTGTAKRNTLFSLPLLETDSITGQAAGTITEVTANTISNVNAGWGAGELSNAVSPYLIQVTSGPAAGRMFLISSTSSNTSTTVTVSPVDAAQVNLVTAGVAAGNTYKIYACDTLSSFFGTPQSSGIQGGSSAANADTVIVVSNGTASTYFYNTAVSPAGWRKVGLGAGPNDGNAPLLPYYGIQFARLGNTALSFTVTGGVPTHSRVMSVKNFGSTIVSQFWPVDSTLGGLGLQNIVGWQSGASANVADTVILTSNGTPSTYFFDGTNWRRVGLGGGISDNVIVPIGTSILVNKKGSTPGFATFSQPVPYSL
jgi:hypothetical protein